jgi:hypothetical protein
MRWIKRLLESLRPETPSEYTQRFVDELRRAVDAPEGYVLARSAGIR